MSPEERARCLESIRPDGFTLDEVYNYIMVFPFELNPYFNSLEFMLMVTERIRLDAEVGEYHLMELEQLSWLYRIRSYTP